MDRETSCVLAAAAADPRRLHGGAEANSPAAQVVAVAVQPPGRRGQAAGRGRSLPAAGDEVGRAARADSRDDSGSGPDEAESPAGALPGLGPGRTLPED